MNDVNAKHVAELRRALDRAPTADLARAMLAAIEAFEEVDELRSKVAELAGAAKAAAL